MPNLRARSFVPLALGVFALSVTPVLAATPPVGDLTFPVDASFNGNLNNGFAASPPQEVHALHGDYGAGSFGALSWCDPWPGTHIQSATVAAYRFHTQNTTTRIEIGPAADGSGGYSFPEKDLDPGIAGGRPYILSGINAQCVGARARQTGAQTGLPDRAWDFVLQGPLSLVDDQGPAVGGLSVAPPENGSWYTGPVTVSWDQNDNDWFRGATGVQIQGGGQVDLGDRPNGRVSATIADPGPDGTQTVQVYRSGAHWNTVTQSAQITVDRVPPSPPALISTPSGTPAPVIVAAILSVDDLSGLAGYQYSSDGGATISTAAPVYAIPGTYATIARAVDKAGNVGIWSAPLTVTVSPPSPAPLAPQTGAGVAAAAPAGSSSSQAPGPADLSRARLALRFASRPLPGGARATVDYGRPALISGRLAMSDGAPAGGVAIALRDGRGAELASASTGADGRFALAFRARRPGRYAVAALGRPGIAVPVRIAVRALLSVRPAGLSHDEQGPLVVARSTRTLVFRGRLRPRALADRKTVQLQYVDGSGGWRLAPAQSRADAHGRFVLRYRFGLPGREFRGVMRVVVPHDRGWPLAEAHGRPFRVLVPA
jgi:hypothetical protein